MLEGQHFNRDVGFELSGCWLSMLHPQLDRSGQVSSTRQILLWSESPSRALKYTCCLQRLIILYYVVIRRLG